MANTTSLKLATVPSRMYHDVRRRAVGLPQDFLDMPRQAMELPGKILQEARSLPPIVGRAVKTNLPIITAVGIPIAAYFISPDAKILMDSAVDRLQQIPFSEFISSAIFMGAIPDKIAQNYEGGKTNWSRLAWKALLGAMLGGLLIRGLLNFQDGAFPGTNFWQVETKIGFSQCGFVPFVFFPILLPLSNCVGGKPWGEFKADFRNMFTDALLKNWVFWGLIGSQFVYRTPLDTQLYVVNILNIVWFAILSNIIHGKKQANV